LPVYSRFIPICFPNAMSERSEVCWRNRTGWIGKRWSAAIGYIRYPKRNSTTEKARGAGDSEIDHRFHKPMIGTVEYADLLSYAPPTNFVGSDTVSYTLMDAFGNSAAGSVQVSVTSTNFQVVPMGKRTSPPDFNWRRMWRPAQMW
jgi:hypothetical protein